MNFTDSSTLADAIKRCENEPIQYIGSIQGYGVLLGVDEGAVVRVVSDNLAELFDLGTEDALGLAADQVFGAATWQAIVALGSQAPGVPPVPLVLRIQRGAEQIKRQAFVHQAAHFLIIEIEGSDPTGSAPQRDLNATRRVLNAMLADTANLDSYANQLVHQVRDLTGFDRVMVYQFDPQWNGKVIAESRDPAMASFLGHHFPASDIPEPARRLYSQNLVRMLADRDAPPVRLCQSAADQVGRPVDLSFSVLRSMSPVHLEYLENMGIAASISVSLLQHGRLWGLMICHHPAPRRVPLKLRDTLELMARTAAIRLSALAFDASLRYQLHLRETIHDLLQWSQKALNLSALAPALQRQILALMEACGLAIITPGERCYFGQTPPPQALGPLLAWLASRTAGQGIFSTHALVADYPAAASDGERIAGLLAIPLDEAGHQVALWFRKEEVRSISWAGDAQKQRVEDALGPKLEPRRSFALREESQRGESPPWLAHQLDCAQTVSMTLGKILAEQSLRESEESLRLAALVYQSSSEAMVVTDAANTILAINPAFTQLTGYPSEEVVGRAMRLMKSGQQDAGFYRAMWHSIHTTGQWRGELWNRHKNGHLYAQSLAINTIFDASGAVWRRVGLANDITERKQVEEKLRVSDFALKAISQGVLISGPDGAILFANDAFVSITGFSRTEILGRNCNFIQGPLTDPLMVVAIRRAMKNGTEFSGVISNYRKDGTLFWNDLSITPVSNAQGLLTHFIGITCDITERRLAEEELGQHRSHLEKLVFSRTAELAQARDDANAANLGKSQFVATMSHEIRTPMNAVMGMIALVKRTPLSSQQVDYLDKTEGAARSLLCLVNDILDFSKMDAGKLTLDLQPFTFDKVLGDLSVILSAHAGAENLEVLFDIDPALPQRLVGDDMRLRQILINLCGNALKFTPAGEVVLAIQVMPCGEGSVTLRLEVRDTGIGIAPEDQQHIFSGFSQAQASTTRQFGGTGLGLAISQRLLALMGSELLLRSELGRGSCFHFELTVALADDLGRQTLTPSEPPPAALKVLIVDDHPRARAALVKLANSLGWQATSVASGAHALCLLQQPAAPTFDAIFVDWQMPGMAGWQTCQRLREHLPEGGPQPQLVILAASAHESLSLRTAAEQALLNGFLVKPLTATMLFDALAQARSPASDSRLTPASASGRLRRLDGMRLLVVEDNLINQQVVEELLNAEGALVSMAANGLLGIEAVAAANPPFEAVLMDLQMPVMDGYAATRVIRHQLGLTDLPVIAMTANAMASDREACLAAGMHDHIGKPFDMTQLVSLLLRYRQASAEAD